jgi:hypothetical protein
MTEPIEEKGVLLPGDFIMIPANVSIVANNRYDLLRSLEKGGKCAEIGVAQGGFSKHILEIIEPDQLIMVDAWDSIPMPNDWGAKTKVDRMVCQENFALCRNVDIFVGTSEQAADHYVDIMFDWIYLDANHSEKAVLEDLKMWWPKIKPNGYLLGHDFCTTGTWPYGVVPAVYEFIKKRNCNLFGMTAYTGEEFPSFVLRKPDIIAIPGGGLGTPS